jgi:hypothetical protein
VGYLRAMLTRQSDLPPKRSRTAGASDALKVTLRQIFPTAHITEPMVGQVHLYLARITSSELQFLSQVPQFYEIVTSPSGLRVTFQG